MLNMQNVKQSTNKTRYILHEKKFQFEFRFNTETRKKTNSEPYI
jgi:hypothetical protein